MTTLYFFLIIVARKCEHPAQLREASILLYYGGKTIRAKAVTTDEQYRLIMECRASGMTDYQWCMAHNIKPGTFYNWVKRLRQSGSMDIPVHAGNKEPARQDIVEIHLGQPSAAVPASGMLSDASAGISPISSQSPVLELAMAGAVLRIPQGTDPAFLEQVLFILKGLPC